MRFERGLVISKRQLTPFEKDLLKQIADNWFQVRVADGVDLSEYECAYTTRTALPLIAKLYGELKWVGVPRVQFIGYNDKPVKRYDMFALRIGKRWTVMRVVGIEHVKLLVYEKELIT